MENTIPAFPLINIEGYVEAERWPQYATVDELADMMTVMLRTRYPFLKVTSLISVSVLAPDTRQLLIGDERHSRRVAVFRDPKKYGIVYLPEDDGIGGFDHEPKVTRAVTFGKLLEDPYGVLELDKYKNDRLGSPLERSIEPTITVA